MSAPRLNVSSSPTVSGTAPAAAATRSARGRSGSPASRTVSTTPSAASAPIAFQYVSGWSSRPPADAVAESSTIPGTSRPASA